MVNQNILTSKLALVRNVLYNKRKEIVSGRTLALPQIVKRERKPRATGVSGLFHGYLQPKMTIAINVLKAIIKDNAS